MQFHYFVLLAAAIAFSGVDALVSTNSESTQAISFTADKENMPVKRLLRTSDEEERMSVQGVKTWVSGFLKSDKNSKLVKQLSSDDKAKLLTKLSSKDKTRFTKQLSEKFDPDLPPHLQKLAGQDVGKAFKTLGLNNVNSVKDLFSGQKVTKLGNVDDFFTSQQFTTWTGHIAKWNSGSKNKEMSVAKYIRGELGDKKTAKLFAKASKSSNREVQEMGQAYQNGLLKEWIKLKPMKTPDEVTAISKSLVPKYTTLYNNAREAAAKKRAGGEKFLVRRPADLSVSV